MLIGRPGVLGLLALFLAGIAAGCTASAEGDAAPRRADVALPSYTADGDAPEFCALLAGSTRLTVLPSALGRLAGEAGNVEARLDLSGAINELEAIHQDLGSGDRELATALDDLVGALTRARDGSLTAGVRDAVSTGLDDVGRLTQPLCEFPT